MTCFAEIKGQLARKDYFFKPLRMRWCKHIGISKNCLTAEANSPVVSTILLHVTSDQHLETVKTIQHIEHVLAINTLKFQRVKQ